MPDRVQTLQGNIVSVITRFAGLLRPTDKRPAKAIAHLLRLLIEKFVQDVWGPQGKAAQENERATQDIVSQIRSSVERIAGDQQLDLVLDAASGFIIYADKSLDLTAAVLSDLTARTVGSTPH